MNDLLLLSRTLNEALQDQKGFELRVGYSLELSHGLAGYYPAIFTGTKRIVLVFDKGLLETVWKMLSPRRSEINENLYYVNYSEGIAFPITTRQRLEELLSGTPVKVLTQGEFEQITADGAVPFSWAPGLIGDYMSSQEFVETLLAALEEGPA